MPGSPQRLSPASTGEIWEIQIELNKATLFLNRFFMSYKSLKRDH